MKSYRSSSTFVTVDLFFHELLPFVQNLFSGLMVADLNLLGSVGDLCCFSKKVCLFFLILKIKILLSCSFYLLVHTHVEEVLLIVYYLFSPLISE